MIRRAIGRALLWFLEAAGAEIERAGDDYIAVLDARLLETELMRRRGAAPAPASSPRSGHVRARVRPTIITEAFSLSLTEGLRTAVERILSRRDHRPSA